ncbi:MAG: bifunctional riboflavin kinase/FAD synthetase [Acidobacteria bacterium]|nr:bifunctional riboflavin kinase/FAD synthetase [Acidobacteriota bacterium]
MLIVRDAFHASDLPTGGIGTIGNFDGVHRGQRTVLARVVERARATDLLAMVVTFEPHPLSVLRPGEAPPRITSLEQKARLLEDVGIDVLLVVEFDRAFARTSAEVFVRDFLHRGLDLHEIYVGSGFTFGHQRKGDVAMLQRLGSEMGFTAVGVDEVVTSGERISSSRIRRAILEGRVEAATDLLGRPHAIRGKVVRGDRMGKRLGWPTINLDPKGNLLPADGVYACQVLFPSFPATFECSTNIGTRPTVYENYQRVVEAHVLDFSSDVYGETVEIEFFKRLREERIFPTVMDLSAQIGRDVEATREYFAARRGLERQVEGAS